VKTRVLLALALLSGSAGAGAQGIVVDHNHSRLLDVPTAWIEHAKQTLHIAYGHTSHGSQLVTGMTAVRQQYGSLYAFAAGGAAGALDLRDTPFSGASDLGNPNFTAWATATRNYLNANPAVNVVIWSWCGQVTSSTEADINTYLTLMTGLEEDFPGVRFVYMTGHLDGAVDAGGLPAEANLLQRNQQIRDYCRANGKWLFDFADIESYDPDGNSLGDRHCTDSGTWDSNGNGVADEEGDPGTPTAIPVPDRNWMLEWQAAHAEGAEWYDCGAAHSFSINANRKAYAAWWLWARLAGWQP